MESINDDEYLGENDSSEESCVGLNDNQVLVIDEIGGLNDILDDNSDSFGVSFYDDLVDISSLGTNRRENSDTAKSLEDEVTLKSKIENNLGLYKIEIQDQMNDKVCKFEVISDIGIGFSNNIIGKGDLYLAFETKNREAYVLYWDGNLLDCFSNSKEIDENVSEINNEGNKECNTSSSCYISNVNDGYSLGLNNRVIYSFPLDYIIDIHLKSIEESHFIFIKSDFQLRNETVFIQFSFNSSIEAKYWFDETNKYKAIQNEINKKSAPDSQEDQSKRLKKNNEISLISKSSTCNIDPEQTKNIKTNSSNDEVGFGKLPEISISEKKHIEETIRNLIFTDTESENTSLNNINPKVFHYEHKTTLIKQRCFLINNIIDSISKNMIHDKFVCPICCESFEFIDVIILNPCGHKICRYCENKLIDSVCPWDRSSYKVQNYLDKSKEWCNNYK
ncbi:ring domain [Cryptosporidium xiaoi]|uniref:Ring domain n=1 Tax=Cryptosporidium xiaoi TaxID=659607 RepID=A0AAV9Y001_9CRYT